VQIGYDETGKHKNSERRECGESLLSSRLLGDLNYSVGPLIAVWLEKQ